MKTVIFLNSANDNRFKEALHLFAEGIRQSGDECIVSESYQYEECDCAIFFGSWKSRNTTWHTIKTEIVNKVKNFIVLETPILGRGPVSDIMQDDWYRIGLNGFLYNTGNFNNKNMPSDRWKKISKEFNLSIEDWKENDGPVLVVLQLPGDASLQGNDISKWAKQTCIDVRKYTKRDIILRTPQLPRSFDLNFIKEIDNIYLQEGTKENLQTTINQSNLIITYSSGLGVESVLSGTPTIAMSPASFVYSITEHAITRKSINHPFLSAYRDQWAHDLSYAQWNLEEIQRGAPWNHLKQLI